MQPGLELDQYDLDFVMPIGHKHDQSKQSRLKLEWAARGTGVS